MMPHVEFALYACKILMLAFTSRSWTELQISQVQILTPSSIRGRLVRHFEHVRVEFLSENSVYIEAALTALNFNICLNIPIPESSEIPDKFLLRFMSLLTRPFEMAAFLNQAAIKLGRFCVM